MQAKDQCRKIDGRLEWLHGGQPDAWFQEALSARTFSSAYKLAKTRVHFSLAVVTALEVGTLIRQSALPKGKASPRCQKVAGQNASCFPERLLNEIFGSLHLQDRAAAAFSMSTGCTG